LETWIELEKGYEDPFVTEALFDGHLPRMAGSSPGGFPFVATPPGWERRIQKSFLEQLSAYNLSN
jgi:hypothetical protein